MSDHLIFHPNELEPFLSDLLQAKILAVDVKTTGPDPYLDRIRYVILTAKDLPTFIIDMSSFLATGENFLLEILSTSSVKVFYSAKLCLKFLATLNVSPKPIFDALLAAQLLYTPENSYDFNFQSIVREYLDDGFEDTTTAIDWHEIIEKSQLYDVARNARLLLMLREVMVPAIYSNGLAKVAELEFQCVRAVAHIEHQGIYLNQSKWRKLHEKTVKERDAVLEELYPFSGCPVFQSTFWGSEDVCRPNFDSNPFVLKLLQHNGIPVEATSKSDLTLYSHEPLVKSLLAYRKASKSLSAFLIPFPGLICAITGRLHPQYEQLMTFSGRMSCSGPNIQQIPRAKVFRECFVAPPGRRLVIADYSQIELRVAAQISRDKRMLSAFQKGEDLHLLTASYLANKPMHLVSKQERQAYKAVNLGFIYGMGAKGLQATAEHSYGIDMSLEKATEFRKQFFQTYRGIGRWHQELKSNPKNEGRTLTGRRFFFRPESALPERSNIPVQGTAADIIKKALWILLDRISGTDTKIVAVVHDEILIECSEARAKEAALILKSSMEDAANSILPDVPTTVETKISESWAEK